MDDFEKKADELLATLEMLEGAVAKSAGSHGDLRKRADDLYQARVQQLAKAHNVDEATAHGLAVNDDVAKRAYAASEQFAADQEQAYEAGGRIAAYVG